MKPATRLARAAVGLSLRVLPPGPVRQRYERELLAELACLPAGRGLRYAAGTLITCWSLRNATSGRSSGEAVMTVRTPRKPVLCALHLHHRWTMESSPDGDLRYWRCTRCDRERFAGAPPPPGTGIAVMGPSGG